MDKPTETEFTHEIRIHAGFDHRDEPGDRRGTHGAEIHMALRGPLGAVVGWIGTGWTPRPLAGMYLRGVEGPRRRRDKPGVDHNEAEWFPRGYQIVAHSRAAREDWIESENSCDVLGVDRCWSTISYIISDRLVEALVSGGDEAAWGFLRGLYDEWLVNDPVEESA